MRIDGPRVLLEPYAAQAIALVLHELATNAAKYGSLSLPDGRISVTWLQEVGRPTVLHWKEMDGPAVQTPTRQGFGARIIERMIGQLEARRGSIGVQTGSFAKSPFRRGFVIHISWVACLPLCSTAGQKWAHGRIARCAISSKHENCS